MDIYDEQEFYISLAKLIVSNQYVSSWIFKIDDEFNGRGTACLNLDHVKSLSALRKKQINSQDKVVDYVMEQLQKYLPKKVIIASKNLYKTWPEYLTAFCRVGGIIEASPNCQTN